MGSVIEWLVCLGGACDPVAWGASAPVHGKAVRGSYRRGILLLQRESRDRTHGKILKV
jgi:hypothetical protein